MGTFVLLVEADGQFLWIKTQQALARQPIRRTRHPDDQHISACLAVVGIELITLFEPEARRLHSFGADPYEKGVDIMIPGWC